VDPFYFGDCRLPQRDFLYAILLSAVGQRPLGLQAAQIGAAARWISTVRCGGTPVSMQTVGPRMGLIGLAAAALEPKAIGALEAENAWGSLKKAIQDNVGVNEVPEIFCFGLLEQFDIRQIAGLVEPRPVSGL